MRWEVRKVYLYLVSLVTFIMLLMGIWTFIVGMIDLVYPGPAPDPCLEALQEPERGVIDLDEAKCAELKAHAVRQREVQRIKEIITSALFVVIVAPAYLYHWRQARRSEQT
ncbi:MAG: hypothetical protein ACOY93_03295 [Bacillota bacterium]